MPYRTAAPRVELERLLVPRRDATWFETFARSVAAALVGAVMLFGAFGTHRDGTPASVAERVAITVLLAAWVAYFTHRAWRAFRTNGRWDEAATRAALDRARIAVPVVPMRIGAAEDSADADPGGHRLHTHTADN